MTQRPFPEHKTAILVIHGIGEQNPFDTLDAFAGGFVRVYQTQETDVTVQHRLEGRTGANGSQWLESFVRLKSPDSDGYVDIHEYYWAYMTEEKISYLEVMQWLKKTLHGAKESFDEFKEAFGLSRKGWRNYWWRLNSMIWHLRTFLWIVRVASFVVKLTGFAIPWARWISGVGKKFESLATPTIVGYIGDIAIYTTMDTKSKHYELRRKIIAESLTLLKSILEQEENGSPVYERVIVAGHSLGSVIAYDTLSRLNLEKTLTKNGSVPVEKVTGLVTFGSPLDKIAFFFRDHVGKDQVIRRQILDQLHSFRARWGEVKPKRHQALEVESSITDHFHGLPWLNVYDWNDPISGKLEFYNVDHNIEVRLPAIWPHGSRHPKRAGWGVAHVKYWNDPAFFGAIIDKILSHKRTTHHR